MWDLKKRKLEPEVIFLLLDFLTPSCRICVAPRDCVYPGLLRCVSRRPGHPRSDGAPDHQRCARQLLPGEDGVPALHRQLQPARAIHLEARQHAHRTEQGQRGGHLRAALHSGSCSRGFFLFTSSRPLGNQFILSKSLSSFNASLFPDFLTLSVYTHCVWLV